MPLRALDIEKIVKHSLGGSSLPASLGFGYLTLANRAGEFLCSLHGWRWLSRPVTTVQVNKGQCYVELPADFGELIHWPRYNGPSARPAVEITNLTTLLDARSYGYVVTPRSYAFLGAIVFEEPFVRPSGQSEASSCPEQTTSPGVVSPRMEIWPTPSENQRLSLAYRATWIQATDDEDKLSLPLWLEPLYIEICREFARGYVYEDVATLSKRLARFTEKDSRGLFLDALVTAAVRRDANVQVVQGRLAGGATETHTRMGPGWHGGAVADPQ